MSTTSEDNAGQVQEDAVNNDSQSSTTNSIPERSEDCTEDSDLDMKRAPLSRGSTLESIKEEDIENQEKEMLESFKSITDVFENGLEEEQEAQMQSSKTSPATTPQTSKSASMSISEDTDSLDEEVRQIMSRSEGQNAQSHEATNEVAINSLNNAANSDTGRVAQMEQERYGEQPKKEEIVPQEEEEKEEEEEEEEEEYIDDETSEEETDKESSIPTDTESISESEPDTELDALSDDQKTGHWSPHKGKHQSSDESDDDEFDLEEHINKLCSHTINSDSSSDSEDEDSDSEAEKQKVINKVMKMYAKKYSQDEESESDDEDDSDVEETDIEDENENSEDELEEVEVNDDESSQYSSSEDDGTNSDFLDDDSASISTESSVNDYDVEELQKDREAMQGAKEEIPYLADQAIPSHEVVYKYYLGTRPENCPEKIEVQDGDINNNIALDNTLTTRSVINLRWPFTSYYVKEFDLDSEAPAYEESGLLPCYKSMKSSASFPGRRRDVMLGRVWWVEWWAKDAVKDEDDEEGTTAVKENAENLEVGHQGVGQSEQAYDTHF